jgi:hypothetical protein
MSEHLSTLQIRHFSARALPALEMSALAKHLASCDACRKQFHQTHRGRGANAPASFTLAPEEWLRHEHLGYEQLALYLDSDLDSEEREILELHLRVCESCRDDVQSLREFRRQIAPEMTVSYAPTETEHKVIRLASPWFGWQWKTAYAAAAVLVLVVLTLVVTLSIRYRNIGHRQAQVLQPAGEGIGIGSEKRPVSTPQIDPNKNVDIAANVAEANSKPENTTPMVVKSPRIATTQFQAQPRNKIATTNPLNSTAAVAELNDGDQKIIVNSDGNVTGLGHLKPSDAQIVKETLLAQNMTRPAELAELSGERSTLRGSTAADQTFRLLSPVGTVTASDRPTFKWEAIPRASSYRVYVGDADNREVAGSGELSQAVTEWTPSSPLPRGKAYTWAVIAKINDEEIIAPAASQPEIKFKVLSADTLRELTALRNSTRSHLALGIFYARAGMLEDAEQEFRALARQNPQSPVVMKLLRSIQSWR